MKTIEKSKEAHPSTDVMPKALMEQLNFKTIKQVEILKKTICESRFSNQDKIEQLKQQLDSGHYKIDNVQIANKLLEDTTVSD